MAWITQRILASGRATAANPSNGFTRRQVEGWVRIMFITLIDLAEAGDRQAAGEQAYEYQTDNKSLRILGPACGFGADYLRRLRGEGLYAETLKEAIAHAQSRNVTLTGVWFVKR